MSEAEDTQKRQRGESSGGYSQDRRALNRWLYGLAGTAVIGVVIMVLKHESDLAVIKTSQAEMREDVRDIKGDIRSILTHSRSTP